MSNTKRIGIIKKSYHEYQGLKVILIFKVSNTYYVRLLEHKRSEDERELYEIKRRGNKVIKKIRLIFPEYDFFYIKKKHIELTKETINYNFEEYLLNLLQR